MKLHILLGVLTALSLASCNSCNNRPTNSLSEQITHALKRDNTITASERDGLIRLVEAQKIPGLVDANGKALPAVLDSCIAVVQAGKPLDLAAIAAKPVVAVLPEYDIYIENSGSMDGYVAGMTRFENAVYNLLTDIKLQDLASRFNMYYINSEVIPLYENVNASAGFDEQIKDFVGNLEPASFRDKGGKRGASNISDVLESVVSRLKAKRNVVSIFVSDCVFSPGKSSVDAGDYLISQQASIKNTFGKIKDLPVATLILRMESEFTGKYYDRTNVIHTLNRQKRPYYIWIIGDVAYIDALLEKINLDKVQRAGVRQNPEQVSLDRLSLYNRQATQELAYTVLAKSFAVGRFKPVREKRAPGVYHAIEDAEPLEQRRGQGAKPFRFAVALNLHHLPTDEGYLQNPDNYSCTGKFRVVGVRAYEPDSVHSSDQKLTEGKGYTHILLLEGGDTKGLDKITVSLKKKLPQWVENSNSDDDTNVERELAKTFGIRYLIEGVYDAYYLQKNSDTFFSFPIHFEH